jgi:peptidoglycan-N-acetylglucosamine deacetylase
MHRLVTATATAAGVGVAAHFVPSVAALGQWADLECLPGELCRWRGPRFPPRVALTFDDGPHPTGTPAILDRLDELGTVATFFPLASQAAHEPQLVAEMARRGHGVGTHGNAHEHHLLRTPRWIDRDLDDAARVMEGLGVVPTWYRPTYGQVTGATLAAARARGWRTVLWSAWGREWTTRDPNEVAARIARKLRPGAIVLLHDSDVFGPPGMWSVSLHALELLTAELDRRGLEAVTLDTLVA